MTVGATVIKAGDAHRLTERPGAFNLRDIQAEADAIVERARSRAEHLAEQIRRAGVERAAELFEQRFRAGYEQGLARGLEEGKAQALAEAKAEFAARHASLAAALTETVQRFEADKAAWCSAVHRHLVELAMEIARRVVKRIGLVDRQAAVANLSEVIDGVIHGGDVVVRAHPFDLEAMRTFVEGLAAAQEQWRHVRLLPDEKVEPGGVVVETESGVVDATLSTQLDRIAAELIPWRSEGR